jgi:hypothetical protein
VQRTILVVLVLVVLAGFAGGAFWLVHRDPAPKRVVVPVPVQPVKPAEDPDKPPDLVRTDANDGHVEYGSVETTVAFPLLVELELVRGKFTPSAPGAPVLGSGSNAQLRGRITGANGQGARAEITFVGGTNKGRVLYTDGAGEFGATDLQPGIAIIDVTGNGIVGSQREKLLRQEREAQLNISYTRPAHVFGTVFDDQNKPLADAQVTFDGQVVRTDETGVFEVPLVAPGDALVLVEKPGFALYREVTTVPFAGKIEKDKLQFRLERAARLQVTVADVINASEQAWFYILPESDAGQRKYPWHLVNPQRVWPGGTTTIEGLPSGTYSARLFQAGATSIPKVASVSLGPGDTSLLEFHLEPAPVVQGIVKDNGKPEPGVTVRLEAPDRTAANLSVFGQTNYLSLEHDVFPNMPSAVQEVVSNARGEFTLSANESVSGMRYITAISKDQKRVASVVVKPGDTHVDLVLEALEGGKGELRLLTNKRIQALPLDVRVNAAPREKIVVPAGRDLRIGDLPSGSWLVTISWNGESIWKRVPVEIDGEATREIVLPEGAIVGQDSDTLIRAGKR